MSEAAAETWSYRRRMARAMGELHYRLRTESSTPGRKALAIGLGTWIGCMPLYGVHLALCAGAARLLGLSRVTTYLAAHVNNPLTAPWLLYLSFAVGSVVRGHGWPPLSLHTARGLTLWNVGGNLLLGGCVIGLLLGGVLTVVAYAVGLRWQHVSPAVRLWDATAKRYLSSGIVHWEFVRGKLRWDPAYRDLLASGVLPHEGTLLDLGSGRGILQALILTAREQHAAGDWEDWPPPPADLVLCGIEVRESAVAAARQACGDGARFEQGRIEQAELPPFDVAVLLDVLHYLDDGAQEELLRRLAGAVRPGGKVVVREPDAALGLRFRLTRFAERLRAWGRLAPRRRFRYRTAAEWRRLLAAAGFATSARPMWAGTPFGNVLIVAERPRRAPN